MIVRLKDVEGFNTGRTSYAQKHWSFDVQSYAFPESIGIPKTCSPAKAAEKAAKEAAKFQKEATAAATWAALGGGGGGRRRRNSK